MTLDPEQRPVSPDGYWEWDGFAWVPHGAHATPGRDTSGDHTVEQPVSRGPDAPSSRMPPDAATVDDTAVGVAAADVAHTSWYQPDDVEAVRSVVAPPAAAPTVVGSSIPYASPNPTVAVYAPAPAPVAYAPPREPGSPAAVFFLTLALVTGIGGWVMVGLQMAAQRARYVSVETREQVPWLLGDQALLILGAIAAAGLLLAVIGVGAAGRRFRGLLLVAWFAVATLVGTVAVDLLYRYVIYR